MKKIFLLFLFLIYYSCSSIYISTKDSNEIEEGVIYKTKTYVGKVDTIIFYERYSKIYTTHDVINVMKIDTSNHPIKNDMCYVKLKEVELSSGAIIYVYYFTWNSTDKEYVLKDEVF